MAPPTLTFVPSFSTPLMASAFFYGTLMHPRILQRVIGHDGPHLQIRPALLLDYTRHKVNDAEYPGIVPYSQSRAMFSGDLVLEERSVRGSLVVGLSDRDMRLLDVFEGDQYTRELVHIYPLGPPLSLDDIETAGVVPRDPPPIPPTNELTDPFEASAYVWCAPLSWLEPAPWTFEEFVRENAWKWVGPASESNHDYTEVDRQRAMEGPVVHTV